MTYKVKHTLKLKVDRFEISSDKVTLPNKEEKTFSYIHFAKGVCILPITEDHQVLVLKQYRHSLKDWQWELPAGAIDAGDSDPLETAKRELEEETGYVAEHWLELGSLYPSPGSTSEEIYLFAAAGLTETEQKLESSEQVEVHKMSMDDLKIMIKNGEFQHGAGLAAILKYKYVTE